VQALLRRHRQAARFGDRHEVSKMAQLQDFSLAYPCFQSMPPQLTKSF
jgi:hypothetical protein